MDVDFQRKVDRIAGAFVCRVLSVFDRLRHQTEPKTPEHLLILLLSEMGALVLVRPMLDLLTQEYPDAKLYALVFRRNKEVLDALGVIPDDNILSVRNDSLSHLTIDTMKALRQMRAIRIDAVLDCELFSRFSSIVSYLSGAKIRVGFHPYTQEGLYRGSFINRPVLYNPYQHLARQFINLAEAIESSDVPRVKRFTQGDKLNVPPMKTGEGELEKMAERLKRDFPQVVGNSLVLLYPGGGLLPIRAWPASRYATLAEDLVRRGYTVGVIGLVEDKPLARQIQAHCDSTRCLDLTGYTKTVRELMLLFHLASLLITNDGGPIHFATMTPVPAIVIYGPETPTLYGPLDDKSTVFYTGLSCSPCLTAYNHRKSPCDGDNICLKSISAGRVLEKTYEILKQREDVLIQ